MKAVDIEYLTSLYKGNNILGMSLLCVSVTAVLLAMFIFSSFVSLQNVRTLLLKNLLVAFLFEDFISLVLQSLVYLARSMKVPDIRCFFKTTAFCEALMVISKYMSVTSPSWVLVLVLYEWRFTKPWYHAQRGCFIICICTWSVPCVPTVVWTAYLAITHGGKCWNGHLSMSSIWIIEGPKLGIMFLVFIFLILSSWRLFDSKRDIININEVIRKRSHVRQCTAVFLWIVISQVTFIVSAHAPLPLDIQIMAMWSYVVTTMISSKGFVVSMCFCFLERDVRDALRPPENV